MKKKLVVPHNTLEVTEPGDYAEIRITHSNRKISKLQKACGPSVCDVEYLSTGTVVRTLSNKKK